MLEQMKGNKLLICIGCASNGRMKRGRRVVGIWRRKFVRFFPPPYPARNDAGHPHRRDDVTKFRSKSE